MKAIFNKHRLFLQVGLVGAVGAITQTLLLILFVEVLRMYPVLANTLAAEIAILLNFTINNYWTFSTRTGKPLWIRLATFNVGVLGSIIIQALCIWIGIHLIDERLYLVYMAVGILMGWVVNYFFYTRVVWFRLKEEEQPTQ